MIYLYIPIVQCLKFFFLLYEDIQDSATMWVGVMGSLTYCLLLANLPCSRLRRIDSYGL